jgi:ribosome maturation factor RimP
MKQELHKELKKQVEELAESLVTSEGMELVDMEYRLEGPRWILRLFIDKPGGVNVDDCAYISRQLGDYLDVKDIIPQAYLLEVSSPGLNRRVRKKEDFSRFAGRKVRLQLSSPVEGRKKVIGNLVGIENEAVIVTTADERWTVPFENIDKANLIHEF